MGAVEVSRDGRGAAVLLLRNEGRRNALDDGMLATLTQVVEEAADPSSQIRLILLRGAGGTFCAGRDVSELADPHGGDDPIAPVARLAKAVQSCPVPTVAVVEGKAVGLGVAMAAWCDFVLAEDGATFAIPEARIGVPPSFTSVSLLHAIGRRSAAAFVLTGRALGSAEAATLGLVLQVCAPGSLDAAVESLSADILRGSPAAFREAKALLDRAGSLSFAEGIGEAHALARGSLKSPDQIEGIAAFREKRIPVWA